MMTMMRSVMCALLLSGAIALKANTFLMQEKQMAAVLAIPDVPVPQAPAVFPVPTTSRCIVIMICQYMIVFTAIAVVRSYHELSGTPKGPLEAGLKAAAQTVTYGPMLCVLFIACHMRVEFLSDGKDQPQVWVQRCMYGVTFAVLGSTLVVLVIPFVTGKPLTLNRESGDIEKMDESIVQNKTLLLALTILRYVILFSLYVGLAGIIVGINIYLPPGADDVSKLPRPAPAVL